jgi:anti-sigma factor NepR-like protein
VDDLSFQNESGRRPKTDRSAPDEMDDSPRTRKKRGPNAEIGQALRKAYRDAVDEDIPPEMLDLLGKLG